MPMRKKSSITRYNAPKNFIPAKAVHYFLTSLNKAIASTSINKIAAISSNLPHPLTDTLYY